MKKAIFIDLDGTLLDSKKELSKQNINAINSAKSKGYEIVVCTGRSFARSKYYADLIGCRYMLFANGSGIYDATEERMLFETHIDTKNLIELVKYINNDDISIIFMPDEERYFTKGLGLSKPSILWSGRNDLIISESIPEFLQKHTIRKVAIASKSFDEIKKVKELLEASAILKNLNLKMSEQSRSLSSSDFPKEDITFYILSHESASKGAAITKFCKLFNISKENRISIGDDINDFSMFNECGYNVAMGNALPELKQKATHITDTNDNNGVAKFINALIKNKL